MNMVGSSASIDAVPSLMFLAAAFVIGLAAVDVRPVFRACSIVFGREACVPGLTNPVIGLPVRESGLPNTKISK